MAVNPVTLNQGDPGSSIHDWGTIYSSALYEVMHNLEAKWGHGAAVLPPLLRTSSIGIEVPSNGRQLAMKLVLESEKMWPCVPDFVTARDALLQADKLFTGGENFCEIWKGFAKRGLGTGTVWATSTEDFTVPEACT